MPQQSFRQPSTSTLDRTQSDPTASENTPKLGFKWKKDGKLSKDYVCTLSGKSTNPDGSKRKHKEPDITIALFRHFKEITIYEPNLSRVEMEDLKGLEVVLLLGAILIREVYHGNNMHEAFNISETHSSNPSQSATARSEQAFRKHPDHASFSQPSVAPHPNQPALPLRHSSANPLPPPTDRRSQWELDAETARLKKQVEQEERECRRAKAEETKRVKRMLEEEDRRRRERQKEVDQETERLRRVYGKEERQSLQQLSQGQAVTSYPPAPMQRPHSASPAPYIAHNLRPQHQRPPQHGPYVQRPGKSAAAAATASSSAFLPQSRPAPPQMAPKKSSFWHVGNREEDPSRLSKQRSTVF